MLIELWEGKVSGYFLIERFGIPTHPKTKSAQSQNETLGTLTYNRHLATKVVLDVTFLDSVGRILLYDRKELLDTHFGSLLADGGPSAGYRLP